MSQFVLKGGMVVLPEEVVRADVVVSDGKIAAVMVGDQDGEVIDCSGMYLIPGAMDAHVHFRVPGAEYKEDWETGSRAAVTGGVTMVLDMPNNTPAVVDQAALEAKKVLVAEKSYVNYGLYIGATPDNAKLLEDSFGVCAVKIYMGSSTGSLLVAEKADLENIFARVGSKILCVHAETEAMLLDGTGITDPAKHSQLRPVAAAVAALEFALSLAEKYRRRLHVCHLSTEAELELVRAFKARAAQEGSDLAGLLSCEVTPHHLFLDEKDYADLGTLARVNPPLRTAQDRAALWQGVLDGTIDMIATDHAPHTLEEKKQSYEKVPSGMPGVEFMLPLLLNEVAAGRLSWPRLVAITSTNPARRFGVAERGEITVGNVADVVVVDPAKIQLVTNEMVRSKCGWTPYAGRMLTGWPMVTLVNGEVVYRDGQVIGEPGGRDLFSV